MSGLGTYEKNALITTALLTSTVYLALWTGDPGPDGAGGAEVSTSSTGYVRTAVTFSSPNRGNTQNSSAVNFPTPTQNWGQVDHWAIFDASTAGNLLFYGAFDDSQEVLQGGPIVTIVPGGLRIKVDCEG